METSILTDSVSSVVFEGLGAGRNEPGGFLPPLRLLANAVTVIVEVVRSGKYWVGVKRSSSQGHCQTAVLCERTRTGRAKDNSKANRVPLAGRVRGASMVVD